MAEVEVVDQGPGRVLTAGTMTGAGAGWTGVAVDLLFWPQEEGSPSTAQDGGCLQSIEEWLP